MAEYELIGLGRSLGGTRLSMIKIEEPVHGIYEPADFVARGRIKSPNHQK
jgi:hypothetical protein